MDNFSKYINDFTSDIKSENHLLIINFFIYFSRFEYAMKRSSYGKLKWNLQYWDADWHKLSQELLSNKIFSNFTRNNVSEIVLSPPKRMDSQNNFETNSSSRNIIDSVKIVRNNLFHGGKFHWWPNEIESERNIKLINESLAILKLIIEDQDLRFQNYDSLRAHFNQYI